MSKPGAATGSGVSPARTLEGMPPTINMGIPGASSSVTGGVLGKRVLLAEPRGYCAGVDRAVETVERALEKHGAPVYVRHEIVHNRHVVETLAKAGAVFVDETDEVPEGAIVVFSAHGVAPTVHTTAAERKLQVIDATCPLVTKVHNEAKRFARDDYDILLIGHEGHEEVIGTAGEAPEHVQLVDGPDAVADVTVRDENKVIWLSQTTLSVDETMVTVQRLRERFPKLQDPPSDDICYATQNRQVAVKAMAPECELVIVVGSGNSSNSVRLVEVAVNAGSLAAHLVDYADDIDPTWLEGVTTVGVTSGASVPEVLVRGVIERLAEYGYDVVQPVTTANETLVFALPREIRPARK
jgi:4-hydroxy-3-methylbut-2-enyl diphosphate reductase